MKEESFSIWENLKKFFRQKNTEGLIDLEYEHNPEDCDIVCNVNSGLKVLGSEFLRYGDMVYDCSEKIGREFNNGKIDLQSLLNHTDNGLLKLLMGEILQSLFWSGVYENITPFHRSSGILKVFSEWKVACKKGTLIRFDKPVFEQGSVGSNFYTKYKSILSGKTIYDITTSANLNRYDGDQDIGVIKEDTLKQIIILNRKIIFEKEKLDPWPTTQEEHAHFAKLSPGEYFRFVEARSRLSQFEKIVFLTSWHAISDLVDKKKLIDSIREKSKTSGVGVTVSFGITEDWKVVPTVI